MLRSRSTDPRRANFNQLEAILRISRTLPTIQLFDAVWQLVFPWLHTVCPRAETYLKSTYFKSVTPENLQRQLHCRSTLWGSKHLWFAGFWSGIIGTYPGSSCGTQPLESFHSYWQGRVRAKARAEPTEIFACMQDLYKDDWSEKFSWQEKRAFLTWPEKPSEALYNSASLRSAGRSPAVDFWHSRSPRLCGSKNYFQCYIRTDGVKNSVDKSGITTFWILRSMRHEGLMPAEAVITKAIGHRVANLIAAEGKELEKWLAESGIAQEDERTAGSKHLNLDNLRAAFANHCAVMEGHLPCSCWPRLHRKVKEPFPTVVCTCVEFLMHGECEHVIFVKALGNNTLAAMLEKMPVVAKKGRKRKTEGSKTARPKTRQRKTKSVP